MRAAGAVLCGLCLLLVACSASVLPSVTTTSAIVHAQAGCDSRCVYWFEYWPAGAVTVSTTPRREAGPGTGRVSEAISGLDPDTVYHSRFCRTGSCDPVQIFRTAGDRTSATVDLGRPLSTADTAGDPISRDAGLSAAWSADESLWLFGDTSQRNGPEFLPGTTAAAGAYTRGLVPDDLREVPTPPAPHDAGPRGPAPFLPAPEGLRATAQQGCDGVNPYPAAWPTGLARIPQTGQLLVVYAQTCVFSHTRMSTQRLSLAVYDPAANRITATHTPFAALPLEAGLPVTQRLGSPVFGGDGHLYLYAHDVTTGEITVARVGASPQDWGDPANYRWWDGSWSPDPSAAVSIASVPFAGSVHVADYTGLGSHRLAMLVQTEFGSGGFQILEASSPAGPWILGPAGKVPDTCGSEGYGCYALNGHAELSTAGRFLFSWYSPNDRHLRVGSVAW
ncbi:hypothetical protein [Actinoplanes aureus]|uniref:DUF4185 domain-containing protein n=1 Tax=Actinoplanes aureus TaxID=2792083 RepID=A0A931CD82_9ACTN|nr:hypothetical protein [Actinoplanes aureus]MBG0565817.1 hypothetical protein [Actinoplanes aureus]